MTTAIDPTDARLARLEERVDNLQEGQRQILARLDAIDTRIDTRIDNLQYAMATRIDNLQHDTDARMDNLQQAMATRIDNLQHDTDARMDNLQQAMATHINNLHVGQRQVLLTIMGLGATLILAVIGGTITLAVRLG